ncbi:MAG: hypothetical protein LUB59_03520 [Candidatus Gastranaerophilales bacterium]|nr:hypothetical protein [Candidatus Gastranaerophilales bacterium]
MRLENRTTVTSPAGVNGFYSKICTVITSRTDITSPENLVLVPRTDFLPSPDGEGRGKLYLINLVL